MTVLTMDQLHQLFTKYVRHVMDEEGTDFISTAHYSFTADELQILKAVADAADNLPDSWWNT